MTVPAPAAVAPAWVGPTVGCLASATRGPAVTGTATRPAVDTAAQCSVGQAGQRK